MKTAPDSYMRKAKVMWISPIWSELPPAQSPLGVAGTAAWRSRNRLTSQNPPGRRSSAPAPIDAPTPAPVKESLAPIAVPPPEPKPAADISVEETRPVAEKKPISTKERRIKQPDGPVELALSIAGCACELTAPDIASAVWMAEHLCDSLKLIEKGTK